ncbi:MAG: glycosyltransferase family 2 protein [Patescibacteria group bacterium]
MMKISAVILAKNEGKNLEGAIQSVSFCDEIIVIDDNSTDATAHICKQYRVRHIIHGLQGSFAEQRNFAMNQATHNWIIYVDADETITDKLRESIEMIKKDGDIHNAFYIKRRDFWWGRELKFGETWKARRCGIIRLVKKNKGRWIGDVHETFVTEGRVKILDGFIDHHPHQTLKEFIHDINVYSTRRAHELYHRQKHANIAAIIGFPLMKFILTYVIYLGFLDGAPGFVYSFLMSFHSFLVRAKLFQYKEIDMS